MISKEEKARIARENGRKAKGREPHNAKYKVGYKDDKWEIIERLSPISNKKDKKEFLCKCVFCGKEKIITGHNFSAKENITCDCKRKRPPNWKGYESLSGEHWNRIKRNAKNRNLEFSIKIEEAWDLFEKQNRKCVYTNTPITLETTRNRRNVQTASLDRIDSSKGYTIDNVQWVHKDVNILKNKFTEERLFEICSLIIENNENKKMRVNIIK